MFERYTESPKICEEYLRLALPLMKKLGAAVHPANYAVFFSYVAGKNKQLKEEVGELVKRRERLTRVQCEVLYRKYFLDYVDDQVERFQKNTKKILTEVFTALKYANNDTSRFGNALEGYKSQLETDGYEDRVQQIIDSILADTRLMKRSYTELHKQLEDSTSEIQHLKKALQSARQEAVHDPLTGLANRKGFANALKAAIAEMHHGAHPPCLLMLDIDRFKRINDNFGHVFGDNILKMVAVILKNTVKGRDTPSRYGGEEFAVILPDTPLPGAKHVAENIRATVEKGRIQRSSDKENVGRVTISIGVASLMAGETAQQLIARADAALYDSKQRGRNRVTVAT